MPPVVLAPPIPVLKSAKYVNKDNADVVLAPPIPVLKSKKISINQFILLS